MIPWRRYKGSQPLTSTLLGVRAHRADMSASARRGNWATTVPLSEQQKKAMKPGARRTRCAATGRLRYRNASGNRFPIATRPTGCRTRTANRYENGGCGPVAPTKYAKYAIGGVCVGAHGNAAPPYTPCRTASPERSEPRASDHYATAVTTISECSTVACGQAACRPQPAHD